MRWLEGGGIDSPAGVRAAGVASGLKEDGALDLAIIQAAGTFQAAGVFTTNAVKTQSAPLCSLFSSLKLCTIYS